MLFSILKPTPTPVFNVSIIQANSEMDCKVVCMWSFCIVCMWSFCVCIHIFDLSSKSYLKVWKLMSGSCFRIRHCCFTTDSEWLNCDTTWHQSALNQNLRYHMAPVNIQRELRHHMTPCSTPNDRLSLAPSPLWPNYNTCIILKRDMLTTCCSFL